MRSSLLLPFLFLMLIGLALSPAHKVLAGPYLQTVPTALGPTSEPPFQPEPSATQPANVSPGTLATSTLAVVQPTLPAPQYQSSATPPPAGLPAITATASTFLPAVSSAELLATASPLDPAGQPAGKVSGITWIEVILGIAAIGLVYWMLKGKKQS